MVVPAAAFALGSGFAGDDAKAAEARPLGILWIPWALP